MNPNDPLLTPEQIAARQAAGDAAAKAAAEAAAAKAAAEKAQRERIASEKEDLQVILPVLTFVLGFSFFVIALLSMTENSPLSKHTTKYEYEWMMAALIIVSVVLCGWSVCILKRRRLVAPDCCSLQQLGEIICCCCCSPRASTSDQSD